MKRKVDNAMRLFSNLQRARNKVIKEAKKWHAKSPYGASNSLHVAIAELNLIDSSHYHDVSGYGHYSKCHKKECK